MAPAAGQGEELTLQQQFRAVFKEHPFSTVGIAWSSVLAGTMAYLWRRQIPTQLKVIQGRIVAQAALLSGAGLAAAVHFLTDEDKPRNQAKLDEDAMRRAMQIRSFDKPGVRKPVQQHAQPEAEHAQPELK